MKKRNYHETNLQIAICKYIKLQYPSVIFTAEASGVNKNRALAGQAKAMRSGAKLPDLMIDEARGGFFGLRIEVKVDWIWLKDGTLSKNKHIQAQSVMLDRLKKKGYYAVFGCGLELSMAIIDRYMKFEPTITVKSAPEASIIDEWYKNNG